MKVLIVSFSDLARDPRVDRQIDWLQKKGHHITALSCGLSPRLQNSRQLTAGSGKKTGLAKLGQNFFGAVKLMSRQYDGYYWSLPQVRFFSHFLQNQRADSYDLIIANDFETLPLAVRYKCKAKILLDSHEYTPEEFTDNWKWRIFFKKYVFERCRQYLPFVDSMMTVNREIAEQYAKIFNIPIPAVLTNAADFYDLYPTKVVPGQIRLIHHGIAIPSRSFERMVELFHFLDDRFTLDLIMVPGDKTYIDKINRLICGQPRIRSVPPVSMKEIVPFTSQYDMGLYLLPPVNFNYLNGLPNKLFEFFQARLAVAIGPSPAMKRFIDRYGCGVVSADFQAETLAKKLNALTTDDVQAMKERAHVAACECHSEANEKIFETCIEKAFA